MVFVFAVDWVMVYQCSLYNPGEKAIEPSLGKAHSHIHLPYPDTLAYSEKHLSHDVFFFQLLNT